MGFKVKLGVYSDGRHYAWLLHCPGCDHVHAVDERWSFNGNVDAPTFRPSLLVTWNEEKREKRCHSFITDGRIQFEGDSTHAMAGQTVDLPDWESMHGPGFKGVEGNP